MDAVVDYDQILENVKELVCEVLELEEDEVTETSLFKDDHDADSLRAIEILAMLEKDYDIKIPQSKMASMVNLKGVVEVIIDSIRAKG